MKNILHYINFIFICLVLVGICILEEVIVSNSLQEVQARCYKIEKLLENSDGLKNMDLVVAVDNLEYIWTQDESNMCFMVNHKNIQEIGQEIVRLKTYIAHDETIEFKVSLEEIKHYCYGYLHFMGASVHNIL